jgi:hypothetical protein
MTNARWVQFPGRSRVLHLIHEQATGWSQGQVSGSLIAVCGRVSYDSQLVDPPVVEARCKMCERRK